MPLGLVGVRITTQVKSQAMLPLLQGRGLETISLEQNVFRSHGYQNNQSVDKFCGEAHEAAPAKGLGGAIYLEASFKGLLAKRLTIHVVPLGAVWFLAEGAQRSCIRWQTSGSHASMHTGTCVQ